ncbi:MULTISPECIES: RidA family protein [Amycolatopsis]|uniref:2-iminobutanoate/2-iminopropanoate deaminase n=2 Tax=Amycolatopsis TaxID=1813 RepID=A0A1I3V081_9PSEU|nr:RidA family protein [Amycolatopsis sacchari]SFJ88333.1 2-iminobutanoate/2-iminopropanoate deaminase [Amycolatopsis sacchari]
MTHAQSKDGHTTRFSPYREAGGFVFVSGQASVDASGSIVPGTFEEEMRRSIENVRRILADAGLTLRDVVKVGAYVTDAKDVPEFNRIYPEYFGDPLPARTTLTGCLSSRIKFEIDVVAYSDDR